MKELPENDGMVALTDESEDVRPHPDTGAVARPSRLTGSWRGATLVNKDLGDAGDQRWEISTLDGNDIMLKNEKWGMALAVASEHEGTPPILAPCDGADRRQRWHLEQVGDNCYRLSNAASGKFLDVYGWYPLEGARLVQRNALGAGYQLWRLEEVR